MIRVDENNRQIWREMGQAIISNPSNKVDVSICCTKNTRIKTIHFGVLLYCCYKGYNAL